MKVRTKLGVAIAVPIALLGAMLVYHIRTTRDAVTTAHELTTVWSRVHRTAIEQTQRVTQALEETAAKYLVTRDPGYLMKLDDLAAAFEEDLLALQSLPLSGPANGEIAALAAAWNGFVPLPRQLRASTRSGAPGPPGLGRRLTAALDTLRSRTAQVSQASVEAMLARLAGAEQAARDAERASGIAAVVALTLSGLIVLLVFRSIARPISRLAEGTLRIGEGRFDHRLDDRRQDEFTRVAADFNRMAERLGEVDRLKRDFISTVSHDLKTPLASMQEATDLLLDEVAGPLNGTQRHLLCLNRDSGRRLGRMLGQLLDLSRLDARPAPVVRQVPVAELVEGAIATADVGGPQSGHRVAAALPAEPLLVTCDPDRCRQLLDNLLDNALKFSAADTVVRVEAQLLTSRPRWVDPAHWAEVRRGPSAEGTLLLAVADQGPGISDAEKSLVFSRFHQGAGTTYPGRRGVGLGLAICREIAQAHGGAIWVSDNAGRGSVFRVLLPEARVAPARGGFIGSATAAVT